MKRLLSSLLLMFCVCCGNAAEPKLTAKIEKKDLPADVPEKIGKVLDAEGVEVSDESGVVCDFWFRSSIPSVATADQLKNGITYREIRISTLIGVVQFPNKWIDFRKQEIPAGVYTLRIAVQPESGDHMGTAPFSDFCLLTPVAKDPNADPMEFKTLQERSSATTGGTHPAVLLLFPNPKPADGATVVDKGKGIEVLNMKRPVNGEAGKTMLGFGFVVRGETSQ